VGVVAAADWFGRASAPAAAMDKVAASARLRIVVTGCVIPGNASAAMRTNTTGL